MFKKTIKPKISDEHQEKKKQEQKQKNKEFRQHTQAYLAESASTLAHHIGYVLLILFRFFKRNVFFALLCSMVISLLYQYTYVTTTTNAGDYDNVIPEEKVIFLLIKENRYGPNKTSFNSLTEHLKTWEFDEENEKIKVKFESMLPSEDAKVVVIYDRGFDSFERYSDLFYVRSFPYEYYFKNQPLVSVRAISSDGRIDIIYNGKRISLEPEQTYPEHDVSNFQFIRTEITNYGFIDNKQFGLMKKEKEEEIVE